MPEPTLFGDDESGLLATFGGAVEYGQNGSVSDKNRYSVKSGIRKSPTPVSPAADLDAEACFAS